MGIASLIIFLILAYGVMFHKAWIHTFDNYFGNAVRGLATPELTSFMIHFTKFGNYQSLLGFTVGAGLILFLVRKIRSALFLLLNGVILAGPINVLVKHFFNRPRPTLHHLVYVHSSSFPSGHSMSIMIVGGSSNPTGQSIFKKTSTQKLVVDLILLIIILRDRH